jgi:hypothetical protein
MSRKLTKLFWCGIFVAIFGSYLMLTNLISIISFVSLYTSIAASLGNNLSGIYYVLVLNVVMLILEVFLVGVGVYVTKKGIIYEQPSTQSIESPPASEPATETMP